MGMIDVLIPLVAGLALLFAPVRPKSAEETAEQLAHRKKFLRKIGGVMMFVAGMYLVLRLAVPTTSATPQPMQPPPLSWPAPAHR